MRLIYPDPLALIAVGIWFGQAPPAAHVRAGVGLERQEEAGTVARGKVSALTTST